MAPGVGLEPTTRGLTVRFAALRSPAETPENPVRVWAFGTQRCSLFRIILRPPAACTRPGSRRRQRSDMTRSGPAPRCAGIRVGSGVTDDRSALRHCPAEEPQSISAAPVGEPAPTDTFIRFDGTEATFADYLGTPLVVNFWASWCPSCVAELSAAIRPAQDRFGDEVGFIGVNLQDDRDRALALIEETGVQFDLVEDAGR